MYLLDTDILIWILRGNQEIIKRVLVLKEKAPLCISVVSIAELYKNIFPSEIMATEEFIEQHMIFDVDRSIAKKAGFYWQQFGKQYKTLSLTDCLIAATANVHSVTLLSLNKKHFPMKDITLG